MNEYAYSSKLMGSDLDVAIISDSKELADNAYNKLLVLGRAYENTYSRFVPESELSKLNNTRSLQVSKEFLDITLTARKIYTKTEHSFNPLFQIKRYGYNKSFSLMGGITSSIIDAPYNIDFDSVTINLDNSTISLHEDQMLDFGGFLKGYVAEKLSELLSDFPGSIVNIGGDLYTRGRDVNGEQFKFEIYNPIGGGDVTTLAIEDSALTTSGTYKRTWKYNETNYHHILGKDGRSNTKNSIISATIIHKDGGWADALTKIAFTLDLNEAVTKFRSLGVRFVLIDNNGKLIFN
ncbi:MAG: FAD:protein FMN transferase [Candidatus Paceibacterota bacterium]|jgi:thiamine biosynthesis lipoprotein